MNQKSLKDCTDEEIKEKVQQGLDEIRKTPSQYGILHLEVSGGKAKYLTLEKPII